MTHELRPKRRGPATSVVTDPLERIVWAASPVYVRRAIYLVLADDIVLIVAYLGLNAIGYDIKKLDLDHENNVPTWYSSAKLLATAASLGLVALIVVAPDRLTRMVLLAPVALFLFLSLDEVASMHEWLGHPIDRALTGAEREDLLFDQTGYWMLVLGPVLAATMLAIGIALLSGRAPRLVDHADGGTGHGCVPVRRDRGRDWKKCRRAAYGGRAAGDTRGGNGTARHHPHIGRSSESRGRTDSQARSAWSRSSCPRGRA